MKIVIRTYGTLCIAGFSILIPIRFDSQWGWC